MFRHKEDGLIKVALKARKTPQDFMSAYDTPKERADEILKLLAEETEAKLAGGAVPSEA